MAPYSRRGVHGQVVDTLGQRIVQGAIAPGELIDPADVEREVRVSRTVVREAVKVLAAKGLVDALPRRGTYVLPREQWNLLDADIMRWRHAGDGAQDAELLGNLSELRFLVEPFAARLAAQRRTTADLAGLEAALEALGEGATVDDHTAADLAFHRAMLTATHNELIARLDVVLEPALRARDALTFPHRDRRHLGLHAAVLEAVRSADADQAETAMRTLLSQAAADTAALTGKQARPSAGSKNARPRR